MLVSDRTCAHLELGRPAAESSHTAARLSAARSTPQTAGSGRSPAGRGTSRRWPREKGRYEEEGWRVRKDGSTLLGQRRHTAPARAWTARSKASARSTRYVTEKRLRGGGAAPERGAAPADASNRVKDYAIFLLDIEGTILTWNTGAEAHERLPARAGGAGRNFRMSSPRKDIPRGQAAGGAGTSRARSAGPRALAGGCARTAACSGANAVLTPGARRLRPPLWFRQGDARPQRAAPHARGRAGRPADGGSCIAMLAHWLRNPARADPQRGHPDAGHGTRCPRRRGTMPISVVDGQLGHLTHLVDGTRSTSAASPPARLLLRDELIDYRNVVLLSVGGARRDQAPRPRA